MRLGWLAALARPVDRGATFRGKRLFGPNKTYRGIAAVGFGTALGFLVVDGLGGYARGGEGLPHGSAGLFLVGLAVGTASMLAELPNSFVKRQLEIPAGGHGVGLRGALFHVLDQIDVLLGAWLVLAWAVRPTPRLVAASAIFLFFSHQLITVTGYALGMRATWR
jgi:CDP-2,3-bis-(O-geranylgeranyl)-sn-glycerol synthase